jgi:D-lactate dehydrogenase (cytochrome)
VPKQATDTAVPPGGIADYIRELRARAERDGIEHVVFGHVGDDHVHVNLLAGDPGGIPAVERVLEDIVDLAVRRGGTVSAEHGIGKLKRAALANQMGGAALASMRRVRRLFDPRERLARGNVFVEERDVTT